jgi:hypothetical protein
MIPGFENEAAHRQWQRDRENFKRLWKLLVATHAKCPNAFERGCGQETMAYEVRRATGRLERPKDLRRALMYAADVKGWVRVVRAPGCTRFFMEPCA